MFGRFRLILGLLSLMGRGFIDSGVGGLTKPGWMDFPRRGVILTLIVWDGRESEDSPSRSTPAPARVVGQRMTRDPMASRTSFWEMRLNAFPLPTRRRSRPRRPPP